MRMRAHFSHHFYLSCSIASIAIDHMTAGFNASSIAMLALFEGIKDSLKVAIEKGVRVVAVFVRALRHAAIRARVCANVR